MKCHFFMLGSDKMVYNMATNKIKKRKSKWLSQATELGEYDRQVTTKERTKITAVVDIVFTYSTCMVTDIIKKCMV